MDLYLIILMFDMLESLESISGLISAAVFAFASFLGIITFMQGRMSSFGIFSIFFSEYYVDQYREMSRD